jgi:hypothetical protein
LSLFLPEGGSGKAPDGVAGITPANATVTEDDIALMERVLAAAAARPNQIPEAFLAYLIDWIQTNNLAIPFGQLFGYKNFISTQVTIYLSSGTTSTSGTISAGGASQTAVGPSITLGAAGDYLIEAAFDCYSDSMVGQLAVSGGGPTVQGGGAGLNGSGISVSRTVALSTATDGVVLTSLFTHGGNSTGSPKDYSSLNAVITATRYANP